ncbi:hypothetical protein Tco_0507679 [Tanacetum coccineum]
MASGDRDPDAKDALSKLLQMGQTTLRRNFLSRIIEARFEEKVIKQSINNNIVDEEDPNVNDKQEVKKADDQEIKNVKDEEGRNVEDQQVSEAYGGMDTNHDDVGIYEKTIKMSWFPSS